MIRNIILIFKEISKYRNYIIIKIIIFICSSGKNKSILEQISEESDYKIVIFKIN